MHESVITGEFNGEVGTWEWGAECNDCDWAGGATINVAIAIGDAERHQAENAPEPETDLAEGEALEPTPEQLEHLEQLKREDVQLEVAAIKKGAIKVRRPSARDTMLYEVWLMPNGSISLTGPVD